MPRASRQTDELVRPVAARRRAVVALVVLAIAAALAVGDGISAAEVDTFRAVARLPDFLDAPIRAVMQLGTLPAVGIVAAVLAVSTRRWQAAVAVAVAGVGARFASDGLKEVVERPRPLIGVTDVVPRDIADGLGFPSTHAAIAFALAGVVTWWLPRSVRPVVWVLAALVALARLYVGVHYPLDAVGGAALGVAAASLAVAALGVPREPPRNWSRI